MALLGHHMNSFLEKMGLDIDVNGKPFPDGPTEHVIVLVVTLVIVGLMGYGAFAAVRDMLRWQRRRKEVRA